jgi:hypothetical protein
MEAKQLEVKGIGSARLRAVIHHDQEPEAWPGPPNSSPYPYPSSYPTPNP